MKKKMKKKTVQRTIQFFRADVGSDDAGMPLAFDPRPALDAIHALPCDDGSESRYLLDSDGDAFCVFPGAENDSSTLRFCRIRRGGLPLQERRGVIRDLGIAEDAGLIEPVHVVFFPNNIVGVEYNHFGPRLARLGPYLREKLHADLPPVRFDPLLRGDVAELVDRLADLRRLEFTITPSYVETVRQASESVADSIDIAARLAGGQNQITIQFGFYGADRRRVLRQTRAGLRRLAVLPDLRDGASRLKLHGKRDDTGRVQTIDLLGDHLISRKSILRLDERSRAIDPGSAVAAIRDAYRDVQRELEAAPALST